MFESKVEKMLARFAWLSSCGGAVVLGAPAYATLLTASADYRPGGSPGGGVYVVDAGSVEQSLFLPGTSGLIIDVDVTVNFTKSLDDIAPDGTPSGNGGSTFNGELEIQLISPAGSRIGLVGFGTYSGQNSNATGVVTFDDAALQPVGGPEILSGSFRPAEDLSRLIGQGSAGDWTLRLTDVAGSDPSSLNAWSIAVTTLSADLDSDGDVDAVDWYTLASNETGPIGSAGNKTYAQGDFDGDGDVDEDDFELIRGDLNTVPGSSSAFQQPTDAAQPTGTSALIYDRRNGSLQVIAPAGIEIDGYEIIADGITPAPVADIPDDTTRGILGGSDWFASIDPASPQGGAFDLPVALASGLSDAELRTAVAATRYSTRGSFDQAFELVYLIPGDTDSDGDIDINDWYTANQNFTGVNNGESQSTNADGDYDGDRDVDGFDIVSIIAEVLANPRSLPTEPKPAEGAYELIYEPTNGELSIDTKGGVIDGYEIISSFIDFLPPDDIAAYLGVLKDQPPDSTEPGFNQGFINVGRIIELDSGAANTGVFSFGEVLPAGLNFAQFLNTLAFTRYSTGGGNFDASFTLVYQGVIELPGDTDGDGDVDDADLGTTFSNYTGPGGATDRTPADGDTDGDGDIDDADLANSFSNFTGPLAPSSVPEPASLTGCVLACMALGSRRRRASR